MSVSNLSAAGGTQPAWQQNAQQFKQDFDSLSSAVQSGDLSTAQQLMSNLQQSQPANASNKANMTSGPLSQDWQNLQQAIQSNDPNAAKQAMTQLQTDMKAHKGGGGHHHHAGGAGAAQAQTQTQPTPDSDDDDDGAITPGGILA